MRSRLCAQQSPHVAADGGHEQQLWSGWAQRDGRVPHVLSGLSMYGHRVVVTGLGAISPIGLTVEDYWQNLLAGVSGVGRITSFDPGDFPVQIAAEVKDFDPGNYMDRKAVRRMERFAQFSIAATGQALTNARFEVTDENAWDVGAIIATGGGGIRAVADEMATLVTKGGELVGPRLVPRVSNNMASCRL